MKPSNMEFPLDLAGIDDVSQAVSDWMSEKKVEKNLTLRTCLTIEELLLRLLEQGEERLVTLSFHRGWNNSRIKISYSGSECNVLPTDARPEDGPTAYFTDRMLRCMDMAPVWNYKDDQNHLIFRVPVQRNLQNPSFLWAITLAILAGVFQGFVGQGVRENIISFGLNPICEMYLAWLHTFAGLMIFFSVITGICSMRSAGNKTHVGKMVFSRLLAMTVILGGLGIVLVAPFFSLTWATEIEGASQMHTLLEMVMAMLPTDPLTPFITCNILQIVILALIVGIVINQLGESAGNLLRLLDEASSVAQKCLGISAKMIPLYIFASLTIQFWTMGVSSFLQVWKPLVTNIGYDIIVVLLVFPVLYKKTKVSSLLFMRKVKQGVLLAWPRRLAPWLILCVSR